MVSHPLGCSWKTQCPPPPALGRSTLLAGTAACFDSGTECDHSRLCRCMGGFLGTLAEGTASKEQGSEMHAPALRSLLI